MDVTQDKPSDNQWCPVAASNNRTLGRTRHFLTLSISEVFSAYCTVLKICWEATISRLPYHWFQMIDHLIDSYPSVQRRKVVYPAQCVLFVPRKLYILHIGLQVLGANNSAPRWTFMDPWEWELRPGAQKESASPQLGNCINDETQTWNGTRKMEYPHFHHCCFLTKGY